MLREKEFIVNKNILSLGLLISCVGNTISSAEIKPESARETLKVLTFNIDTNIGRTEESYARESHPEWRVGARMPKLQSSLDKIITEHSPDVIHLQEGRKFVTKFGDEVDSITPLVDFLAAQGYQVSTAQYNPSDRAFSYITAVQKGFTIDGYETMYLSKSPEKPTDHENHAQRLAEIKDHNFGEEWERSIYIANFHDDQGRQYRARNVHLGIAELGRKQACEMMRKNTEEAVAKNSEVLEVSTGDFNTFPDWGGPAQLEIMKQGGVLEEVTADLRLPTGRRIDSTFIAFPYDFAVDEKRLDAQSKKDNGMALAALLAGMHPVARKIKIDELFTTECKALCGHLDRVYQHGFTSSKATLLPTPQFEDLDLEAYDEKSVKAFIVRHHHEGPAFASDHQPILSELQLPKKSTELR